MGVDTTRPYTVAEVYKLPADGCRYELLDGVLQVTPLARRRHQRIILKVAYRLEQWAEQHGGTLYPGVNVDLDDRTHFEPDVAYSRSDDTSGLAFTDAPDLVVEVSSLSTKRFDRGAKKDRYALAGAAEFWLVDLDADVIEQYVLSEAAPPAPPAVHHRGATFTSRLFSGLVLDVDDLLGPPEDLASQ
jgi:Uma2 family endonuclease